MPSDNTWLIAESGWYLLALPAGETVTNLLHNRGYNNKTLLIKNVIYLTNSSFIDSKTLSYTGVSTSTTFICLDLV